LFLLCYLQSRYQQGLERIAEGFIHHVRQVKHQAKLMAQEQVYQDWQKAARNVSKAANVLHLFVDDSIVPETSGRGFAPGTHPSTLAPVKVSRRSA